MLCLSLHMLCLSSHRLCLSQHAVFVSQRVINSDLSKFWVIWKPLPRHRTGWGLRSGVKGKTNHGKKKSLILLVRVVTRRTNSSIYLLNLLRRPITARALFQNMIVFHQPAPQGAHTYIVLFRQLCGTDAAIACLSHETAFYKNILTGRKLISKNKEFNRKERKGFPQRAQRSPLNFALFVLLSSLRPLRLKNRSVVNKDKCRFA